MSEVQYGLCGVFACKGRFLFKVGPVVPFVSDPKDAEFSSTVSKMFTVTMARMCDVFPNNAGSSGFYEFVFVWCSFHTKCSASQCVLLVCDCAVGVCVCVVEHYCAVGVTVLLMTVWWCVCCWCVLLVCDCVAGV